MMCLSGSRLPEAESRALRTEHYKASSVFGSGPLGSAGGSLRRLYSRVSMFTAQLLGMPALPLFFFRPFDLSHPHDLG